MQPMVPTGFALLWPVVRRSLPLVGISLLSALALRAPAPAREITEITLVDASETVIELSWSAHVVHRTDVDSEASRGSLVARRCAMQQYLEAHGIARSSIVFSPITIEDGEQPGAALTLSIVNAPTAAVRALAEDTSDFILQTGLYENAYSFRSSGALF